MSVEAARRRAQMRTVAAAAWLTRRATGNHAVAVTAPRDRLPDFRKPMGNSVFR